MKSLCIFCGSSSGANSDYIETARALGLLLASHGITLVYGGASIGLMGEIANTVLAENGQVIGVMPQSLVDREVAHHSLSDLKIVQSMHERKAVMAECSDGFIALPGGMGTLEELFEVLTWAQLGFHSKPCGLLNIASYYDQLISFLDHTVDEKFVRPAHRDMIHVSDNPTTLLTAMQNHQQPAADKLRGAKSRPQ